MKSLIFTAAFLCATTALASEITSPFYLPQTGHFLAQTQGQFSKTKQTPGIRTYRRLFNEDLTIGLGAGLAAQIIGNLNWTRQKQNTTVSAPHTQGYSAGLKGQWEIGKIMTQLTALYSQTTDVNFSPRRTIEPHLRLGQELKTMTPYLHLWGQFPLNARPKFNNPFYRA